MTAKKKTLIVTTALVIVLAFVGIFQKSTLNRVESVWNFYHSEVVLRDKQLLIVKSQFGYGGFIHNFKNYVLRGQQKYVDKFKTNNQIMQEAINKLENLSATKKERQAVSDIKSVASQYVKAIDTARKMVAEGKTPSEIDKVVKISDGPAFKAFEIIESTIKVHEETSAMNMRTSIKTLFSSVVIAITLFLSFFVCYIFILFKLIRRLEFMKKFAKDMGDGDLSVSWVINGNDEVASIASVFNEMTIKLKSMFEKIGENAIKVNDSALNFSKISGNMSQEAEGVSERSNMVAAAAEEMSSNLSSVAAAVSQASASISQVSHSSEEIALTIKEITQNTENTREIASKAVEVADKASENVKKLGSSANEITRVTEAISEISEQTNLLALNATIEAARAGEAGKGFAVVANEIKELASQTSNATTEIKEKISGILNSTNETVDDIEKISSVISEVNEMVLTTATAMGEQSDTTQQIAANVEEASIGIEDIASKVAESSKVSEEVARDISEVHQSSIDINESSSKVNIDADELGDLSGELKHLVNNFIV